MRLAYMRRQRVLNQTELQRQAFEPAKRARRFGLVVERRLQGGGQRAVERGNVEIRHRERFMKP
jgi:hypothetical protein